MNLLIYILFIRWNKNGTSLNVFFINIKVLLQLTLLTITSLFCFYLFIATALKSDALYFQLTINTIYKVFYLWC